MATKHLYFNGKNVVLVNREKEGEGEYLGPFKHEDNIDVFSGVKFPVLRAHVFAKLRELILDKDREDHDELQELDLDELEIQPGYDVPATSAEAGAQNTGFDEPVEQNRTTLPENEVLLTPEEQAHKEKEQKQSRRGRGNKAKDEAPAKQDELTLSPPVAEVKVGETIEFATNQGQKVIYESSDESVVTVDQNGLATAVAEGNATIGVQLEDGSQSATAEVSVSAAE